MVLLYLSLIPEITCLTNKTSNCSSPKPRMFLCFKTASAWKLPFLQCNATRVKISPESRTRTNNTSGNAKQRGAKNRHPSFSFSSSSEHRWSFYFVTFDFVSTKLTGLAWAVQCSAGRKISDAFHTELASECGGKCVFLFLKCGISFGRGKIVTKTRNRTNWRCRKIFNFLLQMVLMLNGSGLFVEQNYRFFKLFNYRKKI